MKKLGNNKGFTLVELLAVIVVLAIVMGIAAVAITNVLDSTRKNAYVASAKQFIAGAKSLVNAEEVEIMLGGTGVTTKYTPKCVANSTDVTFAISEIRTEGGASDKTPYGTVIDKANSKVTVHAVYDAGTGTCTYQYSIYMIDVDGVYSISTSDNKAVLETDLSSANVRVIQGS